MVIEQRCGTKAQMKPEYLTIALRIWLLFGGLLASQSQARTLATEIVIAPRLVHLRSGVEREWSEFPEAPHGQRLDVTFASTKNATEQTLFVRQQDVKQVWNVLLNGKKLGALTIDENDMVVTFAIPAGGLVEGDNSLRIESPPASKSASDDIRVGQIAVVSRSVRESLREATLDVEVVDADSKQPLPCRITVLDARGAMQTLGAESDDHLAVRPGMTFSSTGRATLGVPAGRYTIFAGRGFEYSLARAEVTVGAGETVKRSLSIRREVPTEGYVACDTHVHTLTHSGHGDATIEERMITLAGEGIELPIATDHNQHIDYEETDGTYRSHGTDESLVVRSSHSSHWFPTSHEMRRGRQVYRVTRPTPNWSPARIGSLPRQSISSIFSDWTAAPVSSVNVATIFREAISNTSPVEGYANLPSRPNVIQPGSSFTFKLATCLGGSVVTSKTCICRLKASQTQISFSSGVRPMPWLGQPCRLTGPFGKPSTSTRCSF